MFGFIIAFIWLNIGIVWTFYFDDADWPGLEDKVFAHSRIILWPLSMLLYCLWKMNNSKNDPKT